MPNADLIREAIAVCNAKFSTDFVLKKDLNASKVITALQHFPHIPGSSSSIVAMKDTTRFHSGKEGFIITQPYMYVHLSKDAVVPLNNIVAARIEGKNIIVTYRDNTTVTFFAGSYNKEVRDFLNVLAGLLDQQAKAATAAPAPAPKPAVTPQSKPAAQPASKPQPQPKSGIPGQAEFEKGVQAMKQGREQEAIRLFEIAADQNVISAMYNLSMLYGRKKDYAAAFDWMLKAARKGYRPAYTMLSRMYLNGLGTQKDLYATQYWAKMAVQNGDSAAQPLLTQTDGNWRNYLRSMEVGDRFEFGTYPQTEDGQHKPIIWRVLDKQADKMLVLSEYVLDRQPFAKNVSDKHTVWENSTLRTWLHEEFWNMAFQEVDTTRILRTQIHTVTHPDYDLMAKSLPANADKPSRVTINCPDTADRIFIPSWDEIIRYLCNGKLPMLQSSGFCDGKKEISSSDIYWYNFDGYETAAPATPYVGKQIPKGMLSDGPEAYERFGTGDWWLRNVTTHEDILYVYCGDDGFTDGLLMMGDTLVIGGPSKKRNYTPPKPGSIRNMMDISKNGVRPAMWIDLR